MNHVILFLLQQLKLGSSLKFFPESLGNNRSSINPDFKQHYTYLFCKEIGQGSLSRLRQFSLKLQIVLIVLTRNFAKKNSNEFQFLTTEN